MPTQTHTPAAVSLSVQFIHVVSDTLGYATVANYPEASHNGLYSFNPSKPSAGLSAVYVGSTLYPQDVVVGADGYVYVANFASCLSSSATDSVLRIDPATKAVVAAIPTSKADPVGLLVGTLMGKSGIFVAEVGSSYDEYYMANDGAVDFIANDTSFAVKKYSASGFSASRLAAFDATTFVATGYGKTWIVDGSGSAWSAMEVKSGSASFGSSDVEIVGGTAYVPGGSNTIYAFPISGNVSASISVGTTGDGIVNLGYYGSSLYAVDTYSGKVFQFAPSASTVTSSLVTIGQNASGEIAFGAGKAFVAVASYSNTSPGLYYFNLSALSPVAGLITYLE